MIFDYLILNLQFNCKKRNKAPFLLLMRQTFFHIVLTLLLAVSVFTAQGDDSVTVVTASDSEIFTNNEEESAKTETSIDPSNLDFWDRLRYHNILNNLDAGFSISTMGLGLEVKTPVTKWVDIRAGVDWMPKFSMPLSFNLNTYSDGLPTGNFNKVASMLYDMTGISLDEKVNMKGTGSMINFKFMVDIYPVPQNRHWHVTAGFFLGTSKIAKAINTYEEKPTLVGLNIYNRAYEYFTHLESIFDVPLGGGAYMDPEMVEKLQQKFQQYGRMGIHIGDFKDGTPYIMTPAPDGTISARAYVNHFKPYIGAGYATDLDKAKKWHFAVDLGVIFWGGVPDVINHDYATGRDVNFTKDLVNIRGKVGQYVSTFKAFPVYPLVALRLSYSIF